MSKELSPSMRRSVLIAALRDPSMWPEGFKWDFSNCRTCGLGLFRQVFCDLRDPGFVWTATSEKTHIAAALGLTYHDANEVFDIGYPNSCGQVTPAMVADRLEQIHRELESVS